MEIESKVREFVTDLFLDNDVEDLYFHGIQHTKEVVSASKHIGTESGLTEEDLEVLVIAAWFHDAGYIDKSPEHEQRSIEIATEFLNSQQYEHAKIEKIAGCIKATKVPQQPDNILEKILCDADMYHLSLEDFFQRTLLLRKELNNIQEQKISKKEYLRTTLKFMEDHEYKTEYGKTALKPLKDKNQKKIEKKLIEKDKEDLEPVPDIPARKFKSPYRGVESMFRLTANNQISLSSMADNKANILITVNSIILSLIISFLFRQLSEYPRILIPTLAFLTTSLITIIYAILATRPKISTGTFTEADIKNRKVNLLFFGNFYNMSLDEYESAIKEIMVDFDGLYGSMIKDQYSLGIVLARKYKLLRTAYNIFMWGIIISVLAFMVATIPYL